MTTPQQPATGPQHEAEVEDLQLPADIQHEVTGGVGIQEMVVTKSTDAASA